MIGMAQYACPMTQKVDARAQAIAAELKAEIVTSKGAYNSIPKVAKALDTEYTTFYRRVNGKMPLSIKTIHDVLDLLEVNEQEFWTRAVSRMGSK